jgi:hypothetical protein
MSAPTLTPAVGADTSVGDPLDSGVIAGWVQRLAAVRRGVSDAERVEQIRALEHLKSAAAAAQARITADLDASVRAEHADAGLPVPRQGRGVGAQVAFARQESPYRGGRHLGLAKTLTADMPHTLAALESGVLSEWRATLLVRETVCLSAEHRRWIDAELCADPTRLLGWGDRRLVTEIQKLAYQLDPVATTKRRARAESQRRVTSRPAPDTMARISGCSRSRRASPSTLRCAKPPMPRSPRATAGRGAS